MLYDCSVMNRLISDSRRLICSGSDSGGSSGSSGGSGCGE